ncbi:hypothetical protein F2Q70_00020913 [Brassica cretica]|uniref:Ubiquitin-like protease family profile domain-containing protein n=1 Tax=Brassica cretica TaxID=69181 RepID=A0A8S9GIX4_BRACR|nr:hypothetical protein F2Q70_00020913 [Brassica cretica]KAF2556671.1 hypothetical protein F2Q68_00014375 [Brassica cretica]
MCFLDHVFFDSGPTSTRNLRATKRFNGLGRRLPSGAWNYHAGIVPIFCQSMKVWGLDVDDIFAPVNFRNEHWISIWISIPKKHIVVWDSIHSHISPEDLDVVMEPFVTMVLYLLVKCAGFNEQRVQYTLEPYTYERLTIGFSNKNAKAMREKMALDIFKETPGCHSKENEDNDENIATPSTYKPCVASGVCVLSSSIAPTKIAILISSVSPDRALLLEESMCVPQLVVQHKDIYSLSILQTKYPFSRPGIQVWRYADQHMIQLL